MNRPTFVEKANKTMTRIVVILVITLFFYSCSSSHFEGESNFIGNWEANWKTLPESFPGMEDVEFTMSGKVDFTENQVSITAYGYEGCIFSEDTLTHTLNWRLSSDTLHLINDDDVYGMSYKVLSSSSEMIELRLMEDIFLTLKK